MIEAGVRQRIIHEQHPQFSVSQISRHGRNCWAPKPVPEFSAERGSTEIARWLARAEQTFLLAQSQGDSKGATAAVSAAVRSLSALHRKQEKEAEAAKASVDDAELEQITIRGCDLMLKRALAQPPRPGSVIYDYGWLTGLPVEVRALFQRISETPALLLKVQELEKTEHAPAND